MTAPLTVVVASLRETAAELADVAGGLVNDGGGPELSAAAGPVAGLDSGQACREVGAALLRRAQVLGQGMSAFAGKLDSAAFLYEHGDQAAAERIPFDVPEAKDARIGDDPGEPGYDPVNKYEDALRDLIAEKRKGKSRQVTVEAPEVTNVVDLMEALRRSLGDAPKPRKTVRSKASKPVRKKAS